MNLYDISCMFVPNMPKNTYNIECLIEFPIKFDIKFPVFP